MGGMSRPQGNAADGQILNVLPDIPLCHVRSRSPEGVCLWLATTACSFPHPPEIRKWEEQTEMVASQTCSCKRWEGRWKRRLLTVPLMSVPSRPLLSFFLRSSAQSRGHEQRIPGRGGPEGGRPGLHHPTQPSPFSTGMLHQLKTSPQYHQQKITVEMGLSPCCALPAPAEGHESDTRDFGVLSPAGSCVPSYCHPWDSLGLTTPSASHLTCVPALEPLLV